VYRRIRLATHLQVRPSLLAGLGPSKSSSPWVHLHIATFMLNGTRSPARFLPAPPCAHPSQHPAPCHARPTPDCRDIKISGFSMSLKGNELISDCSIELTIGRRYGLIGQNGCGKTNFLQALANRDVSQAAQTCSMAAGSSLSSATASEPTLP